MLEWEEQTLPFLPGALEDVSLWDRGLEEHQGIGEVFPGLSTLLTVQLRREGAGDGRAGTSAGSQGHV